MSGRTAYSNPLIKMMEILKFAHTQKRNGKVKNEKLRKRASENYYKIKLLLPTERRENRRCRIFSMEF